MTQQSSVMKDTGGASELQELLGPTISDQQLLLNRGFVRIRTIIIAAISDNVSIGIPAINVDFCTIYQRAGNNHTDCRIVFISASTSAAALIRQAFICARSTVKLSICQESIVECNNKKVGVAPLRFLTINPATFAL